MPVSVDEESGCSTPTTDVDFSENLSDYELKRLENIRRNTDVLRDLGLVQGHAPGRRNRKRARGWDAIAIGPDGRQGGDQCTLDPPDVSGPVSRSPAASKDGETSGGDGGCTASALSAIGVFPSMSAAVRGLDAEITPQHEKLCRERHECLESEAGIRGEQWHIEAIKQAVLAAGWHFKRLPIHPAHPGCVDLKATLTSGSHLVVGVTNNQWYQGKQKQKLKYPDWPADAPAVDPTGWVHSIAIVNGRVRDFDTCQPLSSLWLQANNQPLPHKGYMRTIRNVWRLHRCARPGTGCKGICFADGEVQHSEQWTVNSKLIV
jgi:hypothetical protein